MPNVKRALVVDDESSARFFVSEHLKEWGFETIEASDGVEALEVLQDQSVDIVLSDQVMPGMDGIELLQNVRKIYGDLPFIAITAHGSIGDAIIYLKQGASDYILKPINEKELKATIDRCLTYGQLTTENKKLKDHLRGLFNFQNIVTRSSQMEDVLRLCEKVSNSANTTVALYGESGVGKEVLAKAIHYAGEGIQNKFIAINCAGIPSGLLESELFGHEKGAFTGAEKAREGKLEIAKGGTLLLDEIGDMPMELQAKLLRVLQERTFERVGSNKTLKADFRTIVSTNKNLEKMVEEGLFREDLYHRINIFPIVIPPLRDRKEDVPLLIAHFVEVLQEEFGKRLPPVSDEVTRQLSEYDWPGNVRELRNCIERAAILAGEDEITTEHFSFLSTGSVADKDHLCKDGYCKIDLSIPEEEFSLKRIVDAVLEKTLIECDGNKSLAAQKLDVDRKMFYRRDV